MALTFGEGTPCWVDLMTPDPQAAQAFYAGVLGWTFADRGEEFGNYLMCHAEGLSVAGIGRVPEGADMPAAWTVYLQTPDVHAAVARAIENGGKVLNGPMEVPRQGHMAIMADPSGAVVGFWQPIEHVGFDAMGSHGSTGWYEVNTWEAETVRDFFANTFQLGVQEIDAGGNTSFWALVHAERPRYGVLQMTDEWKGLPPHWMTYFTVDDVDAAATKVTEHGGKVAHGPFDTSFGRIAVCNDPTGATFSLIQMPSGT